MFLYFKTNMLAPPLAMIYAGSRNNASVAYAPPLKWSLKYCSEYVPSALSTFTISSSSSNSMAPYSSVP